MKTFSLSEPVIRGDLWKQTVILEQTDRDWTGVVGSASLWKEEITELPSVVPDVVATVDGDGNAQLVITLTPEQTQALDPVGYLVKVRVEIPDTFGPYTPVAFLFVLSN